MRIASNIGDGQFVEHGADSDLRVSSCVEAVRAVQDESESTAIPMSANVAAQPLGVTCGKAIS